MIEIRTFVAVELSAEIHQQLAGLLNQLKTKIKVGIRWVASENIHLTLKFLGNTSENLIPKISDGLSAALGDVRSFQFEVGGFGAFPTLKHPRTLWVGIAPNTDLQNLVEICDQTIHTFGFPLEDRSFSPHLTLGRLSSSAANVDMITISHVLSDFKIGSLGSQIVDHLTIFKSDLTPSGPIYTHLAAIPLRE